MRPDERDNELLGVILCYCDRMHKAIARFGNSFDAFDSDVQFQDCVALCFIQIGEAVHRLSPEFTSLHPQIAWRRIYGMRNLLVHGYGSFDAEIAWDAAKSDIPKLKRFCKEHFRE